MKIDSGMRLFFSSYGLLIHPNDVGAFMDVLLRAQPCTTSYSNGTHYVIKPKEIATVSLVPASAIEYPQELQDVVNTIREGGKDGQNVGSL